MQPDQVPRVPSVPSHLYQALEPLLTALESRWLRDFLLTSSPIHLDHLLSPLVPTNSIQLKSHVWNILPSVKFPIGEQVDLQSSCLLRPAFIHDEHVYGVGICQNKMSHPNSWLPNSQKDTNTTLNMRFVLSPFKQSFLEVCHAPLDDTICIAVGRRTSMTTRSNHVYVLKLESLARESSRSERALTAQNVCESLILAQEDVTKSLCVVCGAHWKNGCACEVSGGRPLHPFDFGFFMRNMQPFIADIQSGRRTIYYAFGNSCTRTSDSARTQVQTVLDESFGRNLTAWSISQYLRDVGPLLQIGAAQGEEGDDDDTGQRAGLLNNDKGSSDVIDDILQETGGQVLQQVELDTCIEELLPGSAEAGEEAAAQAAGADVSAYEKFARRRERNRAAARRSNERRKVELATKKAQLAQQKQVVDQLRRREGELRAENLRLRIRVGRTRGPER